MFKQFSANYPRLAPFFYGYFGWFLFNTVVWIPIFILMKTVFAPDPGVEGLNQLYILPFCFIPGLLNFVIVVYFLVKRRWSALGWFLAGLSNLGVYLLLSATVFNAPVDQGFTFIAAFFGFPFYFLLIAAALA